MMTGGKGNEMEKYNYMEHMKEDIRAWMGDNENVVCPADYDDWDEFGAGLSTHMWMADSVTGNASGSYTFSTWKAEECLCHNWDLIWEAQDMFGDDFVGKGPEFIDVSIRCHLLDQAISEVLYEIMDEYPGKTPAEAYEAEMEG